MLKLKKMIFFSFDIFLNLEYGDSGTFYRIEKDSCGAEIWADEVAKFREMYEKSRYSGGLKICF